MANIMAARKAKRTVRSEPDRREAQLRFALERGLLNTPSDCGATALLGALATLVEDWNDQAAFEMANDAVIALVSRTAGPRDTAKRWREFRHGCADNDTLAILDMATAVDHAVVLYRRRDPWLLDKGRRAIRRLRRALVARVGERVPALAELEDLIARHSGTRAKGKITTAGIVARIVHRGRLFGAHTLDEERTLRRVTMVLKRHDFTRRVK